MAAEAQQGTVTAAFPAPPPFYKSFTRQNLDHLDQLQASSPSHHGVDDQASITERAHDVQNLLPPKPPLDGKYKLFGVEYDSTDKSQSTQAVPSRSTLLSLSDRLLKLFLRYVQILGTDPSGLLWVPQWEEIRKTFEEAHHIINEYRPHQARETLLLMMEDQIKQFREETERIRRSVAKTREVMESLGAHNGDSDTKLTNFAKDATKSKVAVDPSVESSKEMARRIWEIVDREVGAP